LAAPRRMEQETDRFQVPSGAVQEETETETHMVIIMIMIIIIIHVYTRKI